VGVLSDRGDVVGRLEDDLLKLLGKRRGVLLEVSEYQPEEILFALRRGEIDIAVPIMTDTEVNAEFLKPCARHLPTGRRVVVHKDIAPFITSLKQLDNAKVVVCSVAGTVSPDYARKIFKYARKASLKDSKSCVGMVSKGTGGVFLLGSVEAWRLFRSPESESKRTALRLVLRPLTKERLAWAVRRNDTTLAKALDEFAADAAKRGDLTKLIRKNKADGINK
jgi:ABC-type amino acid transport substrate-binding protein